jgi:hypothetical protein
MIIREASGAGACDCDSAFDEVDCQVKDRIPRWGAETKSMKVELKVFHASGYDSIMVPGKSFLDEALQARFRFGQTRIIRAVNWNNVDSEGFSREVWDWRPGLDWPVAP